MYEIYGYLGNLLGFLVIAVIFFFVWVMICLYTTQKWAYKTGKELQKITKILEERIGD